MRAGSFQARGHNTLDERLDHAVAIPGAGLRVVYRIALGGCDASRLGENVERCRCVAEHFFSAARSDRCHPDAGQTNTHVPNPRPSFIEPQPGRRPHDCRIHLPHSMLEIG